MADKTIDQLPVSTGLDDNSLLVVQQDGQANSITGALIKSFAREAAASSVQEAANSAKDAKASQEVAENARVQADAAKAEAKQSALNATSSADEAERARLAIENLGVSSTTLAAGSQATVSKRTDWEGKVTLSFGIPNGPQGPQGATGPQGISITSIQRTAGNGAAGTTDTYTITLSNGQRSTFQVRNGADGKGVGDMLKRVYDPQNKAQDVFAYVDRKVGDIPTPDVSVQISAHNTSSTAHQDIRTALNGKAPATHTHTPASIGAASAAHTHTPASIGAAPAYTYGTTDLTAGRSALSNGTLYFQYE